MKDIFFFYFPLPSVFRSCTHRRLLMIIAIFVIFLFCVRGQKQKGIRFAPTLRYFCEKYLAINEN